MAFILRFLLVLLPIVLINFMASAQSDTIGLKIYFASNRSDVDSIQQRKIAFFIRQYAGSKIQLIGRCDIHGEDALNDSLSMQRARSVEHYLLSDGFPPANIDAVEGYGKRLPVDVNSMKGFVKGLPVDANSMKGLPVSPASIYTDSLNRVVWIVLLKSVPQDSSIKISAYSLKDSIILVYPPYPDSLLVRNKNLLVNNKKPQYGDTLRIDTGFTQTGERLIIKRRLFIADDSLNIYATMAPREIPEGTKAAALNQALLDTILASQPGQRIIIRALKWEFGYHSLPVDDLPVLNALLYALIRIPSLQLRIQGHVCCETPGNDAFDKQSDKYDLSLNRAKEIYDYLLAKGVLKNRISYQGFGMQHPMVYPEKGKDDQYRNRRVEFLIVHN
jgi:outer membrane protein OmpA-like peptidoglycan-associated protein